YRSAVPDAGRRIGGQGHPGIPELLERRRGSPVSEELRSPAPLAGGRRRDGAAAARAGGATRRAGVEFVGVSKQRTGAVGHRAGLRSGDSRVSRAPLRPSLPCAGRGVLSAVLRGARGRGRFVAGPAVERYGADRRRGGATFEQLSRPPAGGGP